MVKKVLKKHWLNLLTLVLVLLVLFFARHDLVQAAHMLTQVDLWVFLWIIPIQFLSYYASGAMAFSYLKMRGDLAQVSVFEQPKLALELNFVNHIFPSAGVSGASYMAYRLGKLGVNSGRATLAQVVRVSMSFVSYAALMVLAVLFVTFDGSLTRFTILIACALVSLITAVIIGVIYLLGNKRRLEKFEAFLDRLLNTRLRKFLHRKQPLVKSKTMHEFFMDLHDDYLTLKRNPQWLARPFVWGIVFNLAETGMFFVTFLSLGTFVNPASILISLGLAGLVGSFFVTPGGAGGYEAAMILVLSSMGVDPAVALAGVILARTTLILLTIASGYIFYHSSMKKHGKHAD